MTLPNSRANENEADLIGLELAARAGYNPNAAITLWNKMSKASEGAPPEFMSTHPASSSRIASLQAAIPKVMPLYEQAKKYYDQLKAVNDLIQDARKVRDIILMVGDVSDIYVTNFGKMMNDGNFSPRELDAIAFGYTRLLEESNGVLQDLRQVINVSTLSMTDKDRMDVVDRCYYEMRRYRNLVSYYTNKNIAVSYLRARKKNDLDRVMRLYGNETSKYW